MLIITLALALAATGGGPRPDGAALLRQMNAEHRGGWWTTLIFEQRSTWPGTPGRPEETWYESMSRPGKLRIDIVRQDSSVGGMVFRNDTLYQFGPGRAAVGRPLVHALLVLLHDVHVGDPDSVVAKLRAQGFDLGATDSTTWNGMPITIVGAAMGDSTKPQFWVDTDRMIVVRVMQPSRIGTVSDTRVTEFSKVGPGWVERRIEFWVGGTLQMLEEYTWVKTGVELPASVFDPAATSWPEWAVERR
ncbi:MAG: hypothetical protein ABI542_02140 [Gemmatimonadota bacterium]